MPTRSPIIALMLLINYLLVVGAGCINRPEDPYELLLVQTNEAGQTYQQCRYMRMDGLEAFLSEALASRYQNDSESAKHQLISVVPGIDAHCPTAAIFLTRLVFTHRIIYKAFTYKALMTTGMYQEMDAPPWLG